MSDRPWTPTTPIKAPYAPRNTVELELALIKAETDRDSAIARARMFADLLAEALSDNKRWTKRWTKRVQTLELRLNAIDRLATGKVPG